MAQMYWYRNGSSDLTFKGSYGQIIKGVFNATLPSSGLPLSPSRTWFERGNVDDGGVILAGTGNAYLYGTRRMLLTAAQTGNNSFMGGCDRLSINADESAVTGPMSGHWGMLEVKAGGTVAGAVGVGAVRGDINNSGVLASGGVISCFLAACEKIAGTHTGSATVLHVPNPASGTFDFFAVFGAAPGGITAEGTALSGLTSTYKLLVKCPDGTTGYIPIVGTWA